MRHPSVSQGVALFLPLLLLGVALSGCSKKPQDASGSVPVVTSTAITKSTFPLKAVSPLVGSNANAVHLLVAKSVAGAASVQSAVRAFLSTESTVPADSLPATPSDQSAAATGKVQSRAAQGPNILDPRLVEPMPLPQKLQGDPREKRGAENRVTAAGLLPVVPKDPLRSFAAVGPVSPGVSSPPRF